MKHVSIPNYLRGEAVRHSTYLINRIATRKLKEKTPYESLKKKETEHGEPTRIRLCLLSQDRSTISQEA